MSQGDKVRYKSDITQQNHYATKIKEIESVEKKACNYSKSSHTKTCKNHMNPKKICGKKNPQKMSKLNLYSTEQPNFLIKARPNNLESTDPPLH